MLDLSEVDNILDALRCLPWRRDRRMVQGDGAHVMATCVDEDTAQAIAAAPRLLAALRDEVVRLRGIVADTTLAGPEAEAFLEDLSQGCAGCAQLRELVETQHGIVNDINDECVRLEKERDARPEITPEDAALFSRTSHTVSQTIEDLVPGYADAMDRIAEALRAHAGKVTP